MPDHYYRIPLRLDLITNRGEGQLETSNARELMCSLEESIWNHIYLILTTAYREVRFDTTFGSAIWEYDLIAGSDVNEIRWEGEIKDLVEDSIRHYEQRLESIQVKVKLHLSAQKDAHKRLSITITGKIRSMERQTFTFERDIIIAPFIAESLK
ncbi:GPW/gp25 family protein [Dyadobacter jiangsuensis]|uniref:Gene 25-like lysozyme n=1 Tax=Dyadobacter jiangsuensis TaxID=1591085 RepID=A0A2P8G0C7_9BACT|nr:GPW/gp25 family protein [Dyadobacter jiangsuensis]PSL27428.1 gene 25-like lysozyme [Dyadobacter jiangsuensis]